MTERENRSERGPAYEPVAIERKWQERWGTEHVNAFSDDGLAAAPRPFYNLMMFPYPSAEGLHVGNIYAFTGADIYGRWMRLRGYDVFEPIGFDAFGIHSENFALKQGTHPLDLIPRNVANFTRQLRRTGAMYDWDHTVDTTDASYYRWTQWIFLQLFKAGLAERKEAPVNWCPSCMTVLANEQVIGGRCERCNTPVEQRTIAQWFFRISDYAQRLLDNLEWIDWSESTRKAQQNWIGRSEGAELRFPLDWTPPDEFWDSAFAGDTEEAEAIAALREELDENESRVDEITIDVFTTRPDTVFGATFMVLAPEHPLVPWITGDAQRAAIDEYRTQVGAMDLVARKKTDKEKSGVFTGTYAINPATDERIPVWIADYVLMEYGTGAIMAVPGHDERDFEFATKFALPIVRVVAASVEVANAPMAAAEPHEGVLVNSDRFDGIPADDAKAEIVAWLAERGMAETRVNYRLHDWCISRQRYWGPPIPVVYCDVCGIVPVPESELPVLLPRIENYQPNQSGVSPLARDESWYRVPCPQCDAEARRETDVSDTFLDSAWYFLRYPSANRDDVAFDAELTRKWLPVTMYIGGEEHSVLHLMYARFITMVLKDLHLVDFEEPFRTFRKHGLIIRDGAKMSKSRGNVVVPDDYIERWGADTFRTYLMFLGPYQEGGDFRDQGLMGPYGFLNRLWDTVLPVKELGGGPLEDAIEQKLHATIRKVGDAIGSLSYNTAIAAMMEYLNTVREGGRAANRAEVEPLIVLVAPFAPHIAEELWQHLGHDESLFRRASVRREPPSVGFEIAIDDGGARGLWPAYDADKATADIVEFVVQVNGKLRARMPMPRGIVEAEAREAALADENVRRFVDGKQIRKVVFVPDKLVNIVAS
ncbi:MAG TPA: leucine--tRNA ligase [Longimicrobiales bacterium]|nr:leucine--tRNA ligase [Longimicrobiales bacterium]